MILLICIVIWIHNKDITLDLSFAVVIMILISYWHPSQLLITITNFNIQYLPCSMWFSPIQVYILIVTKYYLLHILDKIFEGSCFEREKSIFEMKHTCTFWTTKCLFWKSILQKSFKTNLRIYTNFEWKEQVLLSIRLVWIHSSSKIWMPRP
jgi:hypothetical protein